MRLFGYGFLALGWAFVLYAGYHIIRSGELTQMAAELRHERQQAEFERRRRNGWV